MSVTQREEEEKEKKWIRNQRWRRSVLLLTNISFLVSISLRERLDFSLSIYHRTRFFFRSPVLIRVVFLSDRDSHRRPNGVVPSVMSVLYVSCRSISPSQQSFLLSHTHDVCLLLSSSQLFREYRPSRRASCVWNMETRTSGARRDFSSFSAPFMRVAKRLPFFPIFLLPLSFLELIILVSGYVSSLTEKTAGRWKRDRTNNSETSLQTAFTFFLCVCCSSFSLEREDRCPGRQIDGKWRRKWAEEEQTSRARTEVLFTESEVLK